MRDNKSAHLAHQQWVRSNLHTKFFSWYFCCVCLRVSRGKFEKGPSLSFLFLKSVLAPGACSTMERRAGYMERPSSAPRPRIRRAPGSFASSPRGAHFAVNMCCLRIRDPTFVRGNHLFATPPSVSRAIATPLLTAHSRMHVGPPPTHRSSHPTRYFAVDAVAQRSMAGTQTFSR